MDFISNQDAQIQEMLSFLNIQSMNELFNCIPHPLKLKPPFLDDGISEFEGLRLMKDLAEKNTFSSFDNYLGAGSYEHYVPALVGAICSKSGFLTSYTPYQAEASQGMLQVIFEFQSAICALTEMDIANASVYDAASASSEAILMALRHNKPRKKVLISESTHPHYRAVIQQYLSHHSFLVEWISFNENQQTMVEKFAEHMDQETAAVFIQSPNFFGVLEPVKEIAALANHIGALTILCSNPLSYGIYASAHEQGADIAVGDCQPFGLALQFGGPYVGYMACKKELVRQLPGRIVGETIDTQNRRGFVLTLQAREQHIRREKATSNICTNQALAALASLVGILWYGKKGIPALALTNFQRASYLRHRLSQVAGVTVKENISIFNEFLVKFKKPIEEIQAHFRANGIEPGMAVGKYFPSLKDCLLVAVTETKSQTQLDRYIELVT